jgi:hypothetical protein
MYIETCVSKKIKMNSNLGKGSTLEEEKGERKYARINTREKSC